MSIGHKGMLYAANAMAMTRVDLFQNKKLVEAVKAEYIKRKDAEVYKAMIPEGPPPVEDN